ncbi:WG repeat-containing protein [Pedobacter nototheniae]|uniref:WG repeat-containing protein n=1 Tax=Pedobacter nototheniae TaxID=2488994 RepID=UPI00292E783C|nr:WG repeat-containing protein [Pedobacter nototheniae]
MPLFVNYRPNVKIGLKIISTGIVMLMCFFANAQKKQKDYLISFTDGSSGKVLTGYKNLKGEVIIPALYTGYGNVDTLSTFTVVSLKDSGLLVINKTGKHMLRPFIYDNGPDYVEEGLFRFVQNEKIGFANEQYKKIIPATFDFVTPFKGGLAAYTMGGHKIMDGEHWYWSEGYETGFINHEGLKFKKVKEVKKHRRLAWTINNQQVLLDQRGRIIKWYKPNLKKIETHKK